MPASTEPDVREVFEQDLFGPEQIASLRRGISDEPIRFVILRDVLNEIKGRQNLSPATNLKIGIGYYLLGGPSNVKHALDYLDQSDGGALAQFYRGKALLELGRHDEALKVFDKAKAAGYEADQIAIARAEVLRSAGKLAESMRLLDDLYGPIEQTAEYLYQRGATVAALGENLPEAIALYERAIKADDRHVGALFGLALENDRRGNDIEALRLYEKAAGQFPTHRGVLINLGLLYEDRDQFDKAARCYKRVADQLGDERARLFLKDVSDTDQPFDEEAQRKRERLSQLLGEPVTNFELSVRSRNCLARLNIRTLADLTRITEQQLMSSKNFGETSLDEIKEMMHSRGLSIGQFSTESAQLDALAPEPITSDEQAMDDKPIADLALSVRARKCMARLGINTLGELRRKSADDLLDCKNFGVTSLNEVRQKLADFGLKLRGE